MVIDTHVHTKFSACSKMSINDAVAQSHSLGLGITITDHLEEEDYSKPGADFLDIDKFIGAYSSFRGDEVLLGVELGMRPELARETSELLQDKSLDFILGSIHLVDGLDISLAQYEFCQNRSKREVYGEYFDAVISCLENHDFIDSLGHIDFIARYAKFDDTEVYYSEFPDYIDGVLRLLAEKQKALEINSQRLDNPETVTALVPIYQRFAELGGSLVTIGSDAHSSENIGRNFPAAFEIAAVSGLKPVWFQGREPHYLKQQ